MNQNMDIDLQINQAHADAERAEADARRIEDRIAAIPGCESFARGKRGFGVAPNPWLTKNVTVQALLHRHDPALATHLARLAGANLPAPDYSASEEQERWNASARKMEAQVAAMQAQSAARRAANEQRRSRGWVNREGQWVI